MSYTSIYPHDPRLWRACASRTPVQCRSLPCQLSCSTIHKAAIHPSRLVRSQYTKCMFTPTTNQPFNACCLPSLDHDPSVSQTTTQDDHHLTKTQNPHRPKPRSTTARAPTAQRSTFAPRNSILESSRSRQLPDFTVSKSRVAPTTCLGSYSGP
jgi:hypothetical protein